MFTNVFVAFLCLFFIDISFLFLFSIEILEVQKLSLCGVLSSVSRFEKDLVILKRWSIVEKEAVAAY